MLRIAVLISGSGSNFQALLDSKLNNAEIVLCISNNPKAYGLQRAKQNGIETIILSDFNLELLKVLNMADIDLVFCLGFLKIVGPEVVKAYPKRIINIHPSLIPKHCGKGYYGLKVHQSVINAKDKITGVTIHYVDEGVDTGKIIAQQEVSVLPDDTAESLSKRVLEVEHQLLVKTIKKIVEEINEENNTN